MIEGDVETAVRAARSWMYTPGTKPELFESAARNGADAVILDLEESVLPADKAAARNIVIEHVTTAARDDVVTSVRINSASTAAGLADLTALISADVAPDVLVLPKMESAGALGVIENLLFEASSRTMLVPLIETARGVRDLPRILASQHRVVAVLVGAADLAANLGAAGDWESLQSVRSSIVLAAGAVDVVAIDAPFFETGDQLGLAEETNRAARLGFSAKAVIHPKQVSAINTAFAPTEDQLTWANRVMSVYAAGGGELEGETVDDAVAHRARRYLRRSKSVDTLTPTT
ncbi:aldolase/citrate lyase family protein [Saccharopolyspora gloriosae]|uniref:aldolase/citrate lyase family protein n=1 Tax=Saccharopolyspora gloriosae TaxID=455344 RepID=UPI001FB5F655|nr:aldolase/citrate lyase family protein [Saccharopolyspora gloriosae]